MCTVATKDHELRSRDRPPSQDYGRQRPLDQVFVA